jgi:hypothetical protein
MFKRFSRSLDRFLSQDYMVKIIQVFDNLFSKLPNLPDVIPNFFVTISPWLALLSGVVGIVAGPLMALLGLLSLVTLNPLIIISYVSSAAIMIVNTFLMFKAFKPLRARSLKGWLYLFWSELLWLINGVVESLNGEQVWWVLLLSNLIGFYLLFEMKRVMGRGTKSDQVKKNTEGEV